MLENKNNMRVYARIFENMLVYAFMRYMLIQNKYKLCFYTFLITLLLILILNFYFEKYAFMLVFPSLVIKYSVLYCILYTCTVYYNVNKAHSVHRNTEEGYVPPILWWTDGRRVPCTGPGARALKALGER